MPDTGNGPERIGVAFALLATAASTVLSVSAIAAGRSNPVVIATMVLLIAASGAALFTLVHTRRESEAPDD